MRIARAYLESAAPYSQSRYVTEKKPKDMPHEDWEAVIWPKRLHVNAQGNIIIPPMAFKKAMQRAASYAGEKIKGRGAKTWTEKFIGGVAITGDEIDTGVKAKEAIPETYEMDAQPGKRPGPRVPRTYPMIPHWKAVVTFFVLDDEISQERFQEYLSQAGLICGIGRFRPENGGFYGRFAVVRIDWSKA